MTSNGENPCLPLRFNPVVVVPTFNNADRIAEVLSGLALQSLPIIVVNDGSTDQTEQVLQTWIDSHKPIAATVIRHESNRGKAAALCAGFDAAVQAGHTHAVTIDSDGQLEPSDAAEMLEASRGNPQALVLGVRPWQMPFCPARCILGRRFSNLAAYMQTGRRLSDTQCGLRVYPLELIRATNCTASRYTFEAEVITRALWAGFDVVEVQVACHYFVDGKRVSHFRPVVDSLRQAALHARLLIRAIVPARRGFDASDRSSQGESAWWRHLASWFNPVRAWRAACVGEIGRIELATALGIGAWVGTLPFFGLHTLFSLYLAWRLHLHPAATVLGSQISIPPLGVWLGIASVWVGSVIMTGEQPHWPAEGLTLSALWDASWALISAWIVGSVVVGFVAALLVFGLALLCIRRLVRGSVGEASGCE